jgi:integral membrane sensor domain MASE1
VLPQRKLWRSDALLNIAWQRATMNARVRALVSMHLRQSLLLCLLYFATALVALQMTRFNGGVAIVWPAGAVLFAALAIMPRRRWKVALLFCFPAGAMALRCAGLAEFTQYP